MGSGVGAGAGLDDAGGALAKGEAASVDACVGVATGGGAGGSRRIVDTIHDATNTPASVAPNAVIGIATRAR